MAQIFVAGASGLIGGFLVRELVDLPGNNLITAFVRSPLAVQDARLKQVRVDFTKFADVGLDARGADLFCTLGTTIRKAGSQEAFRAVDYDAVLEFARWGFERGAARFFIVTALGAARNSKIFYSRTKGETEADLEQMGFASLHIFRPSVLLGPRTERRYSEHLAGQLARPLGFILRGRLAKYKPIAAATVAKAMVAVARTPSSKKGSRIYESDEIERLGAADY